jgi:hypothetical protein
MPTAAKFIGAVAFAIVGLLAAFAYIPHLPEGESTNTGLFPEITAALGFLIGWRAVGAQARRGYSEAISLGLRASLLLVFWALLGFSIYFMIRISTKMQYDNAGEAVLDVPMQMLKYGKLLWAQDVIVILALGGVIGGMITEYAGRRWS